MLKINCERGNAGLISMITFVGVLGLYVTNDQRKTENLRSEVVNSTLSSMAKQANEAALSRTKNLLQKNSNGQPGVSIQNNVFAPGAGHHVQIQQGKLVIQTPDPRSVQWMSNSISAGPQLTTRVFLEKIETDPSLEATAAIAVAETTVSSDGVSKTQRTRARYDLMALNSSPIPAPAVGSNPPPSSYPSSPANPGNAAARPPATDIASQSPPPGRGSCGAGAMSPGNSTASSQTGANSANSSAQGENTSASAHTTNNSSSACAMSQSGANTASANVQVSGASHSQVNVNTSTSPNGSSSSISGSAGRY